jgi:hypothetical protein
MPDAFSPTTAKAIASVSDGADARPKAISLRIGFRRTGQIVPITRPRLRLAITTPVARARFAAARLHPVLRRIHHLL